MATAGVPIESELLEKEKLMMHQMETAIKMDVAPPSYQEQKQEIHSLLGQELVKGQEWYLVPVRWFKQWKRYVGYDDYDNSKEGDEAIKPGPIDTAPLLDNGKLKKHQVDDLDYKIVPESAWYKLISWYGINVDSVGIKREVLEYGKYNKQCKVEVYPLELKACVYPDENEFKIVRLSRGGTIQTLDRSIRESFTIGPDKQTRIYNRYKITSYELMKDLNKEAREVGLTDGQYVLLEIKDADGIWPRTNPKSY